MDATPAPRSGREQDLTDSSSITPPTVPFAERAGLSQLQQETVTIERRLAALALQMDGLRAEQEMLQARQQLIAKGMETQRACYRADDALYARARVAAARLGYPQPRPFQLDVACAVVSGHDTALIYPAGAGKGIAYGTEAE